MPRIAARTECYDTLRECMRHYKAKRDHLLHNLGKTSYIDGSQFVVAFISPKGEVHTYQSALLKETFEKGGKGDGGGILNMDALRYHASILKGKLKKRREEEGKGTMKKAFGEGSSASTTSAAAGGSDEEEAEEEAEDDDSEEVDPDKTLVDEPATPLLEATSVKPPSSNATSPTSNEHCITLQQEEVAPYFAKRFAAVQQDTCKLVAKAWIKVIEPKKQSKFPYNKGENAKPKWWPDGVPHRAPDHLSKEHMTKPLVIPIPESLRRTVQAGSASDGSELPPPFNTVNPLTSTNTTNAISTINTANPRKRSVSPIAVPEPNLTIPIPQAKRTKTKSQFLYTPLQPSDVSWRATGHVPNHHLPFTPLGMQLPDPRQQQPSLHHDSFSYHSPKPHTSHSHHMQMPTQRFQQPGNMIRHHSMYELSMDYNNKPPVYFTPPMPSPVVDDFHGSVQGDNDQAFVFINHSNSNQTASSQGTNPQTSLSSSQPALSSAPMSAPTPVSAPLPIIQPISIASTPTSAEFARSASAQGYMQQQQLEYLETHPPQGFGYISPGSSGQTEPSLAFSRFAFEGDRYDYGMPSIEDNGF
ncbi:hypothetical protein I307_03085 [Cryptococcus deuterogattii 99/473]|uniref:Unplaced genomic scaffold supercont1.12, whole genome shotgun sequence n=1 Tax=Cryptococcus deuterogattii Ram5 TaxID=1296110 RepID=A0A0D0UVC9_9TREE|nr:hypothetical protein I309_02242 [Cryptococcus deuterogattii LA55]KIR32900.1 hypothetical protein I352_04837 [Cryptococcus deuterogattii MMRL2647]KIR39171.1 hypothetical protein I313_04770 [Cryptococcus deuterogattii Ram5]KIR94593.1 hypothetical protein I304_00910 [Cryptococcus deuterogattii CBS 10090]KIS00882.1 hypothetical protein L804_02305 [Cryptococcus deuterogattii 2001/935-1]KIY57591.1 hypothetical protein I307_03085 [Cryptococcus deuterogattii 99/473]